MKKAKRIPYIAYLPLALVMFFNPTISLLLLFAVLYALMFIFAEGWVSSSESSRISTKG